MASSIIFLSDCTPLYTTLGAPERIPSVLGTPLFRSARLEWAIPPNIDKTAVESYIVRYKLTGAPFSHVLNEMLVFFPTATITGLTNGVSYDFWVVAKNRFGESPHSATISVIPGSSPSPCQIVRRAYHATSAGNGITDSTPQYIGIEFTPPLTQNGSNALTFTTKYTLLNGGGAMTDISYVSTFSVQSNEYSLDVSGNIATITIGVKSNYIRKQITPPTGLAGFQSGNYRFQVFSSNIYGISSASDLSFNIPLLSNIDASNSPRVVAPTFSSYPNPDNAGIVSLEPHDQRIRFRWKQYRSSTGTNAYIGWSYRIQYTDDKDNWYYPPLILNAPNTAYYPEYTIQYDTTSVGSDTSNFEYMIDISRNIMNGRRYYVRYCVVDSSGDTSQYTQITITNLSLVSCIPGKLPNPPQIFRASSTDRLVRLYFDWFQRPPSIDLTGGLPILDYRIERYGVTRTNNGVIVATTPSVVFDNLPGPFYEDNYDIYFNGFEYEYRVYSRNNFGYSATFNSVRGVPFFPADVPRNVTASVDTGMISLEWDPPETTELEAPIVEYYIEYKLYTLYTVSEVGAANIVGVLSDLTTITNTSQDLNKILVDDVLWEKLPPSQPVGIFTRSLARTFTIQNLINNMAYVFRVAAVTQDVARRKIIGLRIVIGPNSPYLPRPVIIGQVPSKLTNVKFFNLDSMLLITWTSTDVKNTQGILRFIVDYDIAPSETSYSLRQTFEYNSSIVFNNRSDEISFQVAVIGLSNNVTQRPDSRMNSYVVKIYSENLVGFTNESKKVKLHLDPDVINPNDVYENITLTKVVRPRTIPSLITEERTA